ncbi:MAG: phosphatidylglycerophosphatase A [Candidatus Altiarchaeales archaeon]|nr:phosphatidylglycerophosphatase A [Candidatus Altiarchaeota archaeon]MBU4406883.1 phosphatidylglycerophosphatase A [Candidatus Altiarchaeota archaeon]MCG2782394.1 phosphatidylglycerophosphatase A [Candidatus Altiarchaeales archaeon]
MNEILERLGVEEDELVEAAFNLYVSHGLAEEEAKTRFRDLLDKYLKDINVSSLLWAGILLNEKIKPEERVDLVADEILGMDIANYIAGIRGVFEFVRYDKAKPGILGKLDPFLDDVVGGLIAGIMSKIYGD